MCPMVGTTPGSDNRPSRLTQCVKKGQRPRRWPGGFGGSHQFLELFQGSAVHPSGIGVRFGQAIRLSSTEPQPIPYHSKAGHDCHATGRLFGHALNASRVHRCAPRGPLAGMPPIESKTQDTGGFPPSRTAIMPLRRVAHVLIRRAGDRTWREPAGASYATEKDLENLVKGSPEVIPGIPPGPAAVATQLHVPDTGPADVVVIDTEGGITVIECKLRANPEVRRWVIGQVFSYASGIALMSVDELDGLWRMRTGGDIISSFTPALPDEVEESVLLARIAANLQTGRLRLVIAVDAMTDELKRTVTYINGHSGGTFELLALELEYIKDGDVEILVPTVYGEESAAHKAASTGPAAVVSGRAALYKAFWAKYLERLHQTHPDWTTSSVAPTANWMSMRSPLKGTFFSNSFSTGGKLRHELYIDTGDTGTTDAIYQALQARQDEIEKAYGRPLQWEPLPNRRATRIADYTDAEVTQEDRHDEFITFLIDAGERMRRAMAAVLPLSITATAQPTAPA